MPPRFVEEISEYLRVNGPATASGIASHFSKWGADDEDVRLALEWLIHEGRVVREQLGPERFRLTS
ncbi:MAG TPA: hypothetical protein VEY07_08785 [Thermoplasmata archaeon]|nr:hypothetical protein [Thermoplasmata archaeon]